MRARGRVGWCVVGSMAALAGWACGGGAHRVSDIPVVEMVLDLFGSQPGFTAEDSAAVQRLENGDGPVRFRMVMCGEVLVDEVVSSDEEFSEVMETRLLEEFEWAERGSEVAMAELEALDSDSVAAAWMASLEAMTPAEREEFNAEMERLVPLLNAMDPAVLDTIGPEALEAIRQEALGAIDLEAARESGCEQWRKMRAEFRKKTSESGSVGKTKG